jgi:Domain of unknown function (DUF1707)
MPGELTPDKRGLRASHDDRDEVVERLRVAAGDGRLTPEELDERLESALTARTYGDLEKVLVDLPDVTATTPGVAVGAVREAKDLVRLHSQSGSIKRDGPWVVPLRLDIDVRSGSVFLDFTEAVITRPSLEITIAVRSGHVTFVVPPDVAVDVDDVTVRSGHVRHKAHAEPGTPLRLAVTVSGSVRSGQVTVRPPRQGFWATLRKSRSS